MLMFAAVASFPVLAPIAVMSRKNTPSTRMMQVEGASRFARKLRQKYLYGHCDLCRQGQGSIGVKMDDRATSTRPCA